MVEVNYYAFWFSSATLNSFFLLVLLLHLGLVWLCGLFKEVSECVKIFSLHWPCCVCVYVSVSVWYRVGEQPVRFGRFALCSSAQWTGVYGLMSSEDWISTPSCWSWALIVLSACGLLPNSPQNGCQSPSAALCGPLYYRSRLLRPVCPVLPHFTLPVTCKMAAIWLPVKMWR